MIIIYSKPLLSILIMYSIIHVKYLLYRILTIKYLFFVIFITIALSLNLIQKYILGTYPFMPVGQSFVFVMVNMQLFIYPMLINMI
jgi:hypothetical protein